MAPLEKGSHFASMLVVPVVLLRALQYTAYAVE